MNPLVYWKETELRINFFLLLQKNKMNFLLTLTLRLIKVFEWWNDHLIKGSHGGVVFKHVISLEMNKIGSNRYLANYCRGINEEWKVSENNVSCNKVDLGLWDKEWLLWAFEVTLLKGRLKLTSHSFRYFFPSH